jgi:hypothetical protein
VHHEELSARERAVLFALLCEARVLSNAELQALIGIPLQGKERRKLNDLRLVESQKAGRGFAHALSNAGWRWCADELAVGQPAHRTSFERSHYLLFRLVSRYLAAARLTLPDLAQPVPPARAAGRHVRPDAPDGDLVVRTPGRRPAAVPGDGVLARAAGN